MKTNSSLRRSTMLILIALIMAGIAQPLISIAAETPPVAAPLVREGTYAVRLAYALRVVTTENEIEAINRLAEVGISPRNGWISNYPVTPDIIAELQATVADAAYSRRLVMGKDDALRYMADINNELGLSVVPAQDGYPLGGVQAPSNPTVINNYYYNAGPPVVTYYAPPPDFVYLYAWVPSPFWYAGFWFPGFYILNDFHRTVIIHDHAYYVSNHYRDRSRRYYRIDPGRRHTDPLHARFESPRYRDDIRRYRSPVRDKGVIEKLDERMKDMRRQNQPVQTRPATPAVKPAPQVRPRQASPAPREIRPSGAPARDGGAISEINRRMEENRRQETRHTESRGERNPGGHGPGGGGADRPQGGGRR